MTLVLKDSTVKVKPQNIVLKGWRKLIDKAEKRECGFTNKEVGKSLNWNTCACGERSLLDEFVDTSMYKRDNTHILTDRAKSLGCTFYNSVKYDDFNKARGTLKKIESLPSFVQKQYRLKKKQPKIPKPKIQTAKTILKESKIANSS